MTTVTQLVLAKYCRFSEFIKYSVGTKIYFIIITLFKLNDFHIRKSA